MADELKILILEDVPVDAELMERELHRGGIKFSSRRVDTRKAFLKELKEFEPDLILGDYKLPSFDGLSALEIIQEKLPDVPFIFVSGAIGEEMAIETLKRGATDYVLKNRLSRLVPVVNRALREAEGRTKRKQSEEALRKSEEKYRSIIENIQEGYFENDLAGNFTFVNDALCRLLGYPREELIGKNNRQYTDEKTAKKLYQVYNRIYRTGEPSKGIEEEYIRKDGVKLFAELSVSLISDAEGKPIGFRGVARDVSERRQAEKALRESETRFRTLFEAIPDNVLVHDDEGTILQINEIGAQQLEWSAKDLIGRNLHEIVASEKRLLIADHIAETHKVGWSRFETTYVSRSKWKIEAEVNDRLIKFGEKKAILRVARDITKRKEAEKALLREKNFSMAVINSSPGLLFVFGEKGNIIQWNSNTENITGYSASEIAKMNIIAFVAKEDAGVAAEGAQKALTKGHASVEINVLSKSGKKIPFYIMGLRTKIENSDCVVCTGIDITDRKRAEDEVKRGYEQLRETLHSTVKALASTVEMRDRYTAGHQPRVTQLACAIAEEMGLPPEQIEGIRMASSIHDIGKIVVPAEILNKPGPVTELQFEMIKMHPQSGHDILKGIQFPWPVAEIVRQHHERLDGSGYPRGLKDGEIMPEARILIVANALESMTAHRLYRPASSLEKALEEMSQNKGKLYDREVVDACVRLFTEKGFTFGEGSQTALAPQANE